jgi:septal ring factor EnvC (AmiA/AmiB activator)
MSQEPMSQDKSQSQDVDLDRTDKLPILDGALFDEDVEDDAVRLDFSPVVPSVRSEFPRASAVDLPSLAESVRSVEERIARQNTRYEALEQSYEKARDAEAAAVSRSQALAADLAELRAKLESEQARAREIDKTLAEKNAAAEAARVRIEQVLRDAERHQSESHTLRDTLAARDVTIVQVLHSLGERDAQLNALQREHAKVVPALEERSKAGAKLEADLRAAQARAESLTVDLKSTQQSVAALTAQLKAGKAELNSTRRDLHVMTTQAASHLEHLRTREWRRGFDQNLFRELDAKVDAAQEDRGVLQSERDQLRRQVAEIEGKLATRDDAVAKLKAAAVDDEAQRAKHELKVHQVEGARTELMQQIAALQAERNRLSVELATRDAAVAEALAARTSDAQHGKDLLAAAEKTHAELSAQIERLQSEAQTQEDEMAVLVAHLREARRPMEPIQAEIKRLTDDLDAKTLMLEHLNEENRNLRAALERTRGALEEREFLIRRLERSESNNANVLGRIQTSIERLGSPGGGGNGSGSTSGGGSSSSGSGGSSSSSSGGSGSSSSGNAAVPVECTAELVRVDGQHKTAHMLSRRSRIGRAPGCEIQIESSSVSRHHALVHVSSRDVIIEDLNSTNGVLVNGRKVTRQPLNDGDLLTIGDAQFRMSLKVAPRVLEAPEPGLAPDPPSGA